MKTEYTNDMGNERSVEVPFITEKIEQYFVPGVKVLDVGGVPTNDQDYKPINELIQKLGVQYDICDFRGGRYQGDFVSYDFKGETFDIVLFLSSLEHFPQCTEGDMVLRNGEDRKGFEKALKILNEKGKIILTVPFGKHIWQPYHQNYNWNGILELSRGTKIIESCTYELTPFSVTLTCDTWTLTDPQDMEDIIYDSKAHGVGCFVFEKLT